MADDIGEDPRFSQAQIRTIAQIVAAALAQDRAQNQNTPPSSSQPAVEESSDEEEKVPVKIEIEKSITVQVGDVPEDEDEQLQLAIQKSLADQEEQWYYSSEEEFMVCVTEASTESEQSKRISEFEDFLGIGDEASKLMQEQKAKARILQSVLAAEGAERKKVKMKLAEEKIEATPAEGEEGADADEVIQAIRDTCNECIEQ
ncbi:hypothetical protein JCGZ_15243 [Jatropha curcas]|uniref:Uncharacterized protein n=1 Tax=Jatropha curcas TaxID=180498 RepID=A0A067KFA7_JATCU|nr:hypothetical protein JCGZ_15243 [Jatropha curcas]